MRRGNILAAFMFALAIWPLAARPSSLTNNLPAWVLRSDAQVKGPFVYLRDILEQSVEAPALQIVASPAPGLSIVCTRQQITAALEKSGCPVEPVWAGAERVKVIRAARALAQGELCQMLTQTLQRDVVQGRGELELRLTRPWASIQVPDDLISARILELPTVGVTPNFIVKFELRTENEVLGSFQTALQAKVWSEIWVARSAQPRGRLVSDADLVRERRDLLVTRDALSLDGVSAGSLELAENLPAGAPLLSRSVRFRPVVNRGKSVDGVFKDGALTISVRVEVLEDGLAGQSIRVRNQKTRRELQARVQDEQTVRISL